MVDVVVKVFVPLHLHATSVLYAAMIIHRFGKLGKTVVSVSLVVVQLLVSTHVPVILISTVLSTTLVKIEQ